MKRAGHLCPARLVRKTPLTAAILRTPTAKKQPRKP
jgi:hypothetical protein